MVVAGMQMRQRKHESTLFVCDCCSPASKTRESELVVNMCFVSDGMADGDAGHQHRQVAEGSSCPMLLRIPFR